MARLFDSFVLRWHNLSSSIYYWLASNVCKSDTGGSQRKVPFAVTHHTLCSVTALYVFLLLHDANLHTGKALLILFFFEFPSFLQCRQKKGELNYRSTGPYSLTTRPSAGDRIKSRVESKHISFHTLMTFALLFISVCGIFKFKKCSNVKLVRLV